MRPELIITMQRQNVKGIEWKTSSSPPPKKICQTTSATEVLFCMFFDKAWFTSEREQNANMNAACENDAYVYIGKFVHCSAFAEAANRPCSQAVRKPVIAECKKNDDYI